MTKGYYIGELAHATGLNTNTIRYYESQGLLPPASRSRSGYRVYTEEDADRLSFIQKAKAIGLSLLEIKDIIDHRAEGSAPCARVAAFLDEKLAEVDRRIKDLQAFREDLSQLRRCMARSDGHPGGKICGYIEDLELKGKGDQNGQEG